VSGFICTSARANTKHAAVAHQLIQQSILAESPLRTIAQEAMHVLAETIDIDRCLMSYGSEHAPPVLGHAQQLGASWLTAIYCSRRPFAPWFAPHNSRII